MPQANRRTGVVAAVGLGALLAACGSSSNTTSSSSGSAAGNLPATITIGAPLDISGSAAVASVGAGEQEGEQLAVDEINSSGFLGSGTKLTLKVVDTQASKEVAVQTLTDMTVRDKVDGIVGFTLSPSFLAAAPLAQKASIPSIAVDLSGTGITEVGDYMFRVSPALVTLFEKTDPTITKALNAKTAAYLFSSDSANTTAQKDFRKKQLEGLGIKTVAEQGVTGTAIDMQTQLTTIKQANPDVLVFDVNGGQDATVAQQIKQAGLSVNQMGDVGWNSPNVLTAPGAQCTILATVWDPSISTGKNPHFLQVFQQKYNKAPGQYAAWGYDGVWLYATALKNAGTNNTAKVRDALANLKDFQGTLGVYGFDANRTPTVKGVTLQVNNGKAVPWTSSTTCTR
jgi:branched-chain amino acid transport system substrate-binding protein